MDTLSKTEQNFMESAFQYARKALAAQEVPVGCIFVYQNKIIAVGRNEVNDTCNATRHAEIICIDQVVDICKNSDLIISDVFREITVFVTVEPCIMCAAALYNLCVKSVIFGCKNDRFGGQTVFNVADVLVSTTDVKGGYRAEEAMCLLKEFYANTNPNAPESKVKVKRKVEGETKTTSL